MQPRPKLRKVFRAGFVATLIMTGLMYAAPLMGMPKMDIAAMLGSFVTQSEAVPTNAAWSLGMLIHFVLGALLFPAIYVQTFHIQINITPILKGVGFGLILWFLAQVLVMPMMGAGTFSVETPRPMLSVIGSLIGHLLYGAVLGQMIGQPFRTRTTDPELETSKSDKEVPVS